MKDLIMHIGDKLTEAAVSTFLRIAGAAVVLFGPPDFVGRAFMREDGYEAIDKWEASFKIGDKLTIERVGDEGLAITWNGKNLLTYEALMQFFLEDGGRRPC